MRLVYVYGILLILSLGLSKSIHAQDKTVDSGVDGYSGRYLLSINLVVTTPVGPTLKSFKKQIYGLNVSTFYQLNREKPLFLGLELGFGQYDSESLEYYDFIDYEEYLFRETTSANLFSGNFLLKYFPGWAFWRFEPYIDLGLSIRNSYGFTTITNVDIEETSSFKFEKGDWSLGYLLGIGSLIDISTEGDNGFLNLKISQNMGSNSFFYINKGEDVSGFESPIDRYRRRSIPFYFLKFDAGLIVYF